MRQITTNLLTKETNWAAKTFNFLLEKFNPPPTCERNFVDRSVSWLRWGLGFIYLWFGVLKFFPSLSPAENLAGATLQIMTFGYLPPQISLLFLAIWETAIGLALLTGKFQRAAIISLYFHVAGTFFPLFLFPEQTWKTPFVAASLEGKYIFKNLITLGAALVINATEGCDKYLSRTRNQ